MEQKLKEETNEAQGPTLDEVIEILRSSSDGNTPKYFEDYCRCLYMEIIPFLAHQDPKNNKLQIFIKAQKYFEDGILSLFDFIIKQHTKPNFLAHVLIGTHGKEAFETLRDGGIIFYHGDTPKRNLYKEISFSIHGPAGSLLVSSYGLNGRVERGSNDRYGAIIFNKNFFEKICSRSISDEDLDSIKITLDTFQNDYHNAGHEEKENIIEELTNKIKKVNGYNLKKLLEENIGEKCPLKHKEDLLWKVWHGAWSIYEIRKGCPNDSIFTNSGYRAMQLTKDRDLRSLPITQEDIKYLISTDKSNFDKGYKVLKQPFSVNFIS